MPHLFIGTPVKDSMAPEMVQCIERASAVLRTEGFTLSRQIEPRGGCVVARNLIAAAFERSSADGLLFVDSDVCGFSGDDVLRIVRSGEDVVGGPIPGRSFEPDRLARAVAAGVPIDDRLHQHSVPLLFWQKRDGNARKKGDLLEVDGMGTGFLYLSRRAITAVGATMPLTFLDQEPIRNVFDFFAADDGQLLGEDRAFCERWRALGGTIWADTRTSLIHMGRTAFQAPPLASRLVPAAAREPGAQAPHDPKAARAPSAIDLVGFECPPKLLGDALAVAGGEYEIAAARFPGAPTILDIGANVGAFARWARARFPGAKVHCFEPHPELGAILERNVGRDVVSVTRAAVGPKAGRGTLVDGAMNACQSSLYADVAAVQGNGRTFDVEIVDAASLPAADVLKIDTEGAELDILRRYLTTHAGAPSLVMLEFHRRGDRQAIEALCGEHGLELVQATVRAPHSGLMWLARTAAPKVAAA